MGTQGLRQAELRNMQLELREVRKKIARMAERSSKDTIRFLWEDGVEEEIHFTRVWTEIKGGAFGRSLDTVSNKVSLIVYTALGGVYIPTHSHPDQLQTLFVAEGSVRLHMDGKRITLRSNDIALIPRGTNHFLMIHEDSNIICRYEPRKITDISSPHVVLPGT